MHSHLHNGFAGYLARHRMQSEIERVDGAVVLLFDRRYRVFCRPAPHGDLVLESRVIELPTDSDAADSLIQECLFASWVRLPDFPDIPTLSEDGLAIVIQLRVPSDASVNEVESALETYVNALSDWRRIFKLI
jgi:hypothetical protein